MSKIKRVSSMKLSTIPTYILEAKNLSSSAKVVFSFLFTQFNCQKQVKISQLEIANKVGLSKRSVMRGIKSLINFGLIRTVKNDDEFDRTNIYEIGDLLWQ